MADDIVIKIDDTAFKKSLGVFIDQAPYALSKGINNTLVDAQGNQIQRMKDKYTIRRPTFLKMSVKITKFAKKDDLVGRVGIADIGSKPTANIFGKFEDGGSKTGHGHNIAIPTVNVRPDKGRVIPVGKRPRNLKNSFKIMARTGKELIMQSKGRGKNKKISVAYVLKASVHIPNNLRFVMDVSKDILANLNHQMEEAVAIALKTARLK